MIRIAAFTAHQHDFLSALIEADTRGNYSHIALEVDRNTHTIIEAFYPKVRQRQLADAELGAIDYFGIKGLTPEHEAQILDYCHTAIDHGERYSLEDLLRFNPFFRLFLGEAKDTDPSAFCSMFAMLAVQSSGLVLLNAPAFKVDPYRLTWSTALEKEAA